MKQISLNDVRNGDVIRVGTRSFDVEAVSDTSSSVLITHGNYSMWPSLRSLEAFGATAWRKRHELPQNIGAVIEANGQRYIRVRAAGDTFNEWHHLGDSFNRPEEDFDDFTVLHYGWDENRSKRGGYLKIEAVDMVDDDLTPCFEQWW